MTPNDTTTIINTDIRAACNIYIYRMICNIYIIVMYDRGRACQQFLVFMSNTQYETWFTLLSNRQYETWFTLFLTRNMGRGLNYFYYYSSFRQRQDLGMSEY